MKYFFIVQGEGRGHMTQALSLSALLRGMGHEIVHVVVGKSPQRSLPSFFLESIAAPVTLLESPNFVTDKDHKSVKPFRTVLHSFLYSPTYLRSIRTINTLVKETQPDVIINFYDFLGGLYNFLYRPQARFICVAHQYLLEHPSFTFPEGHTLDRHALLMANALTRLGAEKVLCLSFQYFEDLPEKQLYVVPPLLRKEVKEKEIKEGDHLLVYMVNPGYGSDVEKFHAMYPQVPIHCFWDKKEAPSEWRIDDTLTFHRLDDKKFLKKMASCKGYVTTAGFESVCEAMYLGKPVLMIPVEGHFEQACNAVDAEKAKAGIIRSQFEIEAILEYIPNYQNVSGWFRPWADGFQESFIKHLC